MDSNSTNPSASGGQLLPGQSPPLSVISPTDQRGVLIIATALGLIFAIISLLIRLFVRFEFRGQFAKDDVTSYFGMVFALIQSSLVLAAVSKGFGRTVADIPLTDLLALQKELYVSDIMYILTMWLTKCSVAFLFLRLSPDTMHKGLSRVSLATSTLLMVVSVFLVSLRCNVAHPWILVGEECPGLLARWKAVVSFDILTEVGLFGIAVVLVQGLRLSLRKKFMVMLAFALRLALLAPAVLRLAYLQLELSGSDASLEGVVAVVCTQIELCYAVVATTTPCLRPFMSALNTHYGGPKTLKTPSGTIASSSDNGRSTTHLPARPKAQVATKDELAPTTRWDGADYHVAVRSDGELGSIEGAESSKKLTISKNTEWAVDYEDKDDVGRAV